jgi:hypothetical protein
MRSLSVDISGILAVSIIKAMWQQAMRSNWHVYNTEERGRINSHVITADLRTFKPAGHHKLITVIKCPFQGSYIHLERDEHVM